MKNNRITKNYASILLVLFVIGLLLTGTLSTAYAAEYQTIADLNGIFVSCECGKGRKLCHPRPARHTGVLF